MLLLFVFNSLVPECSCFGLKDSHVLLTRFEAPPVPVGDALKFLPVAPTFFCFEMALFVRLMPVMIIESSIWIKDCYTFSKLRRQFVLSTLGRKSRFLGIASQPPASPEPPSGIGDRMENIFLSLQTPST